MQLQEVVDDIHYHANQISESVVVCPTDISQALFGIVQSLTALHKAINERNSDSELQVAADWCDEQGFDKAAQRLRGVLVCNDCATTVDVKQTICPFSEDVHGETVRVDLCDDCHRNRRMDV